MNQYPNIFRPGKLGTKVTKNRIYYAPMGDSMANADGSVSEQVLHYYQERAKGGAAIIIPGVVCVDYPHGKSRSAQQFRLDAPRYVNGWSRMADAIHRYGALLLPQLNHGGIATNGFTTDGLVPVAISANNVESNGTSLGGITRKVLTIEEIEELEQKYITAAVNAKLAMCDGVMIHAGSHYLVGNFVNNQINQRTDEYGGSIENRVRFACNIIRGIRKVCGRDFIVGIRISAYEEDCEENRIAAKYYEEAGADFIDASFPMIVRRSTQLTETFDYPEGPRKMLSKNLMGVVGIPVFNNGNYKTPEFVEQTLAEGSADYIGLGRAMLCDPDWCNKARVGKANEIRICLSCCECANNNVHSRGLRCALNPEVGREFEKKMLLPSSVSKKVVVVGGGIAGMQAAITASQRRHSVVLLEKTAQLGGQMHLACVPPHKQLIKENIQRFADACSRAGVDIRLNTEATMEEIQKLAPDHVILAIGSTPFTPPINGVENTVQAWDLLSGKEKIPKNAKVVIVGGGIVGCELAELLSEYRNKVTILERFERIAPDMIPSNQRELMLEEFPAKGVTAISSADVKKIFNTKSVLYEKDGRQGIIKADMVILSTGQKSISSELPAILDEYGISYDVIGDAARPGRFISATFSGYCAGINL